MADKDDVGSVQADADEKGRAEGEQDPYADPKWKRTNHMGKLTPMGSVKVSPLIKVYAKGGTVTGGCLPGISHVHKRP